MVSACGSGAGFTTSPSASDKTQPLGASSQTALSSAPVCGTPIDGSSLNLTDLGDVSELSDEEVLAIVVCRAKALLASKKKLYAEAVERGDSEERLWSFRGLLYGLDKLVVLLETDESFARHHVQLARNPAAGPPDRRL